MMYPQVLISGLILLLPAAVDSFSQVHGVVGHLVTLPCTYPVSNGMSSMCWGRGECTSDTCGQTLIRTDGHKIYYRTNNRYQLKSELLQGNVSLTIESVAESDSGVYCCRVETKGQDGVQSLNFSLQVQPVWTSTVTSSPNPWNIHTEANPTEPPSTILTKGFYIGISVSAVLLILASILTIIQCRRTRKKKTLESNSQCNSVAFHAYRNEAFESAVPPQVEDTVSITEDGFQPTIKSQLPSEATSPQSCRKK
ncbi:hepatitis A virus cellular receptor 1 homolog [Psammomys obesus]|uniref:hepatitis A virus cellular receptor 1 homolog n=1 Tax=Psammomys obesus TaxID=48139 RepID=UPI00245284C3|nr:hepatitis A virus cellular receptor 1 homolog [Psammomys obesus]